MNCLASILPLIRLGLALPAFLLLGALSCSGGDSPVEPPVVPPAAPPVVLVPGVYVLAGIEPTLPHSDLEPLRAIVGDASFVALGESTHTSRGFYDAKFRLIRFLVEEMGFRLITFETAWLEALPATRYVESCAGSAEAAVSSLYTVWRDASVREMLRWMCQYNLAHPNDRVTFLGMDIQEPWKSVPALAQFVQAAAPSETHRVGLLNECLGVGYAGSFAFYSSQRFKDHAAGIRNSAAHDACIGGITGLETWISASASSLQSATSATRVEEARIALLALRAYEDQLWIPDPGGYQARDYGMAESIRRLRALHAPAKKTIIWAWNWHISRRYEEVRGFNDDPQAFVGRQGARNMGSFLHEAYGGSYRPIGLIGHQVYQFSGVNPPVTSSPLAVEKRLHDLGRFALLVDLRQPLSGTLLPPGTTYQVSQEWGDPYRQFDALVYLDVSMPMQFLP